MRHGKIIAASITSFAVGGYLAWAATSDYYEDKIRRKDEFYEGLLREKDGDISSLEYIILGNLPKEDPVADDEWSQFIGDDGTIEGSQDQPDYKPKPDGELTSAQLIERAKFDGMSLVKEPGPAGGHIELIKHGEEPEEGIIITSPMTEVDGEEAGVETESEPAFPPGETPEETASKLQSLINQYTSAPEDRDIFVAQGSPNPSEVRHRPPHVISQIEFAHGEDGENYHKAMLTFYARHNLLVDTEDESPIEDIVGFVGLECLRQFGFESNDPDTVFVRNDRLATDFEIVREIEDDVPIHIRYGMERSQFESEKKAGNIPDEYS